MQGLDGKVVLITGGSSGIGRATALRLADLGARIVLAARHAETLDQVVEEIAVRGAQACSVPTDVTDCDQCQRAVEAAVERFGGLDVLICSAGVSLRANFADCALDVLEGVMRVNFFGTLYATYSALPHIQRSRGSLVAISSMTGLRGIPSYAVYGASKFAIQGLYDSLRLELAKTGVHVGVVSPGFVDTPLRRHVLRPDGQIWDKPPPPPFHIWPVELCAERVVQLIVKRRRRALLPRYVGPLLGMDLVLGNWIGDMFLARMFRPDTLTPPGPDGKRQENPETG
jgi:NAD(P)-dependent dehydrogenase (short-subunit alcohol dehydrogenase family)